MRLTVYGTMDSTSIVTKQLYREMGKGSLDRHRASYFMLLR